MSDHEAVTAYTRPSKPDLDELPPGTVVGEFCIERKLGQGGMGTVYGAVHPVIGKRGAIKVLHAELCTEQKEIDRFVQEARAANQIGHPNIVDVFAFGNLPDGRSYLIMEWLTGESLRTRMRKQRHGVLPRQEVHDIASDIVRALEATHAKGIIHRDLKPDNVFLVDVHGERSRAKLLDFGVAKLTGEGRMDQTRPNSMLGTPQYIAPEQARGEVDVRADIYALGIMLFEMLAGRTPFIGDNALDVVSMHLLEKPPRLSTHVLDISPAFDSLIDDMLAKDAADRPTLLRIRAGLADLVRSPSKVHETGVRTLQVAPPPRSTWRLKLALAVVLGAVAMAITFLAVRASQSTPDQVASVDAAIIVEPSRPTPPPPHKEPARAPAEPPHEIPIAPAAGTGTLVIRIKEAGATMTVDGKAADANTALELPPGRHKVAVLYKQRWTKATVIVHAGRKTDIPIEPKGEAPSNEPVDDPKNNGVR